LPATVIPAGLSSNSLPIRLQIIEPEYGDLFTIEVAKLLENEGLGFNAPNSFPEIN
jgi:Asp-tRNA(Asn)/Glu-tRNA(Gln) amidotransferase A subunit family amidase